MVDRNQIQVAIAWAKITHNNRVKRINKPSSQFEAFIAQVKAHFKELEKLDYLYDADGNRSSSDVDKFVLYWQSASTTEASILD